MAGTSGQKQKNGDDLEWREVQLENTIQQRYWILRLDWIFQQVASTSDSITKGKRYAQCCFINHHRHHNICNKPGHNLVQRRFYFHIWFHATTVVNFSRHYHNHQVLVSKQSTQDSTYLKSDSLLLCCQMNKNPKLKLKLCDRNLKNCRLLYDNNLKNKN